MLVRAASSWPVFFFINILSITLPCGIASQLAQRREGSTYVQVLYRLERQAVFDFVRGPGYGHELPEAGGQVRACQGGDTLEGPPLPGYRAHRTAPLCFFGAVRSRASESLPG